MSVPNVTSAVKTCCVLLNFLREMGDIVNENDTNQEDEECENEPLHSVVAVSGPARGRLSRAAKMGRQNFVDYFSSAEGAVHWQEDAVARGQEILILENRILSLFSSNLSKC
jgi:hypothetical protein